MNDLNGTNGKHEAEEPLRQSVEERTLVALRTLQYILRDRIMSIGFHAGKKVGTVEVTLFDDIDMCIDIYDDKYAAIGLSQLDAPVEREIEKHLTIALNGYPLISKSTARSLPRNYSFDDLPPKPVVHDEHPYGI